MSIVRATCSVHLIRLDFITLTVIPVPCELFRNIVIVYGEELLASRPTPKLQDHPLSAVRDCLFNLFAATLHICRPFLHPQPEDAPCRGDRDPITMTCLLMYFTNHGRPCSCTCTRDRHVGSRQCSERYSVPVTGPIVAQMVGRDRPIALLFHDHGTRGVSGQQHAPAVLYPRERPGTHCTGGWVVPRAGLDGRKISPHRDSIPGPSSPSSVAIPPELSGP